MYSDFCQRVAHPANRGETNGSPIIGDCEYEIGSDVGSLQANPKARLVPFRTKRGHNTVACDINRKRFWNTVRKSYPAKSLGIRNLSDGASERSRYRSDLCN